MKTEDELDAEIAQMFDEVKVTKVEMVNGKPKVTDEQTVRETDAKEVEAAMADIVRSWREFRAVNSDSPIVQHDSNWWRCLCYLALAEDRLKEAFCGRDRSPASIRQYHKWRLRMIDGRRYRADA